ncbi:MAG: TIM barrel protein [Anditalea sp.]
MELMTRRTFMKYSAGAGAGLFFAPPAFGLQQASTRLFKISLNPFAIGVSISQQELLPIAIKHGFEAILPIPAQLADMEADQRSELLEKMNSNEISWDAAGLPVDFRKDDELFKEGMTNLPKLATALQKSGVDRMSTWIMPTDQELTYLENFKRHAYRLKEITTILENYDIKLGLEYVGPKTLTSMNKYPFISSMKEAFELIHEINVPNLGIQLDSFHWYCAEESIADIESLTNEQIITCDLNDATAGRTVAEQIDGERELPGDSGVIDLAGFLKALIKIGYNGPVRAEPFNAKLNNMDDEEAILATSNAMKSTINKI